MKGSITDWDKYMKIVYWIKDLKYFNKTLNFMARNLTLISNEQNISCGKPSNNVQWQMSEVNHGKRSMLYLLH